VKQSLEGKRVTLVAWRAPACAARGTSFVDWNAVGWKVSGREAPLSDVAFEIVAWRSRKRLRLMLKWRWSLQGLGMSIAQRKPSASLYGKSKLDRHP
jgi:hypothetical protein